MAPILQSMGQDGQALEAGEQSPSEIASFESYLQRLSAQKPDLEALISGSILSKADFNVSAVFTKFAVLLNALKVPGPCDVFHDKLDLGFGAHFFVTRQDIQGLPKASNVPTPHNMIDENAAIKKPKFILDVRERLDLCTPQASRQVRHMVLEIAALCHPKLRSHNNIVNLLAWGFEAETWHSSPFIALELASNNLSVFWRQSTNIPIALKHHISLDIAAGLDAVHDIGVIHGDIKPENILMFFRNGWWVAKLADFSGGANASEDSTLEGLGTVGWRAPELRNFHEYGTALDPDLLQRIDSYSYGLTLWCMFLGDGQSSPCPETAKAQGLALTQLERADTHIPRSVNLCLKTSLTSLLESSPHARPKVVRNLLNDGSLVYSEWKGRVLNESSEALEDDAIGDILVNELPTQYEWEVQEINIQNAKYLQQAFLRGESLSATVIDSLFLKMNPYGWQLQYNRRLRDELIQLLQAGVRQNSTLAKACICQVIDYFEIPAMLEIRDYRYAWLAEAIVTGSFHARQALRKFDAALQEDRIRKFRENGGYNQFYAHPASEIISQMERINISQTNAGIENTYLSAEGGDSPLHVISSALNPTFSRVLEKMAAQVVNSKNASGETPLYRACMAGVTSTVLKLLSKGADPTIAPRESGPTCLHWLFNFDPQDVEGVAKTLIANGADVHSISKDVIPAPHYPFTLPTGSPLHWAVEMSALDAVRTLLRLGANPQGRDGTDPYTYDHTVRDLVYASPQDQLACSVPTHRTLGFSVIDIAVKNWDYNALELLLSHQSSFDPNDCDEEGFTAFHRLDAGEWRYTTHMSQTWPPMYGGDPTVQEESLAKTVSVLCRKKFDINRFSEPSAGWKNAHNIGERTPLMNAVAKGAPKVIMALVNAGADPNLADREGRTALLSVTERYTTSKELQAQIVSILLSANADILLQDHQGCTPLLRAAACGLPEIVRTLVKHGANLSDRLSDPKATQDGWTPLAFLAGNQARKYAQTDEWMVDMLRSFVICVTPIAGQKSSPDTEEILERSTLDGRTLLHFAARNRLIRTCSILIEEAHVNLNGFRKREKWRRGGKVTDFRTPLDEAIKAKKGIARWSPRLVSEDDFNADLAVYDDIVDLLRKAGGVRARDLVKKEFIPNVPIGQ